MLILANNGPKQTIGFRQRRGQDLDKVCQTWSNIIDGLVNTRHSEIRFPISIVKIEEYGNALVLVKFETNWMVRLREQSRSGTQHMSISHHT